MTDILSLIKAAVAQVATDDPVFANVPLEAMEAGHGIRAWRDRTPEESRKRKERKHLNDLRSAARRRDRTERSEAATKERQARIGDPARMAEVYHRVITPIRHLIVDVSRAKGMQIARHIGAYEVEDVTSDTIERVAIAFCGYNLDLDDLAAVAKEWRHHKTLPRDLDGIEKIMAQTINLQARKAVTEWWRANPTLDSIEKLTTLAHQGYGADNVVNRSIADGDLSIVGWRPTSPGQVDPTYVSHIINGILEARHLQDVSDVIMGMEEVDGELVHRLNTDGSFPWYRYSRKLWLACGLDEAVYKAIPKDKRAKAAQTAVRNRFAIVQAILERAYRLLADMDTDLNDHRKHIVVGKAPIAQADFSAAEMLDALRELMEPA
jgi:hypothetical protein